LGKGPFGVGKGGLAKESVVKWQFSMKPHQQTILDVLFVKYENLSVDIKVSELLILYSNVAKVLSCHMCDT
jgi:hypothetical protein